jgi:hypothetical protein
LLPSLIENYEINKMALVSIIRLHNRINFIGSKPDYKELNEEQFIESSEWNLIRELAKETLLLLKEPIEKPDRNYI